jgi:ABC-type nitrate/sulfonate/bicarbonate transport system substrate-binding protein
MKIFSHDLKSVFFYFIGNFKDTFRPISQRKKVAVASLSETGTTATRASLKALGVDPDRDVTLIVIAAASVRMAAMEIGSVEVSREMGQ